MIALDTNVLLRLLLDDDPRQAGRAQELVERTAAAGDGVLLPDIVLCELEWVLDSAYGFSRARVAETLRRLLDAEEFEFIDRPAVVRAIASYETGNADFSDYLIGGSAAARGASVTYAFDRALLAHPGFVRPG